MTADEILCKAWLFLSSALPYRGAVVSRYSVGKSLIFFSLKNQALLGVKFKVILVIFSCLEMEHL